MEKPIVLPFINEHSPEKKFEEELYSRYKKYLSALGIKTNEDLEALSERKKNDQMELKDYLCQLLFLPAGILGRYQFLPSTQDERDAIDAIVFNYGILTQWIYYLRSGTHELPDLLRSEAGKGLKPLALYKNSMFDLCVHICEAYPDLTNHQKPAELWIHSEAQSLHQGLMDSGLLTGKPQRALSRNQCIKEMTVWLQELEFYTDSARFQYSKETSEYRDATSTEEAIREYGIMLANENRNFRNSKTWRDYQKNIRGVLRMGKGELGKNIKSLALKDGKFLPSGRNEPRLPNRVKKK